MLSLFPAQKETTTKRVIMTDSKMKNIQDPLPPHLYPIEEQTITTLSSIFIKDYFMFRKVKNKRTNKNYFLNGNKTLMAFKEVRNEIFR